MLTQPLTSLLVLAAVGEARVIGQGVVSVIIILAASLLGCDFNAVVRRKAWRAADNPVRRPATGGDGRGGLMALRLL